MRLITVEEHTADAAVARAGVSRANEVSPHFAEASSPARELPYGPTAEALEDLGERRIADGERRIADKDARGIDMYRNAERLLGV